MHFALPTLTAALVVGASSAARGTLRAEDPARRTEIASAGMVQEDLHASKTIVTLDKGQCKPGQEATCCDRVAATQDARVVTVLTHTMKGCVLELPVSDVDSLSVMSALSANVHVSAAELDTPMFASQDLDWGLDRIDQEALPLDGGTTKMDADGTKVYILDTGIKGDHNDFAGMWGPDDCHLDVTFENNPRNDGNGHGTHVASTTCGHDWGVAENCQLCAVKVLSGGGSGSTAGVIEGIEFAMTNCADDEKCVINMSLGGGKSTAMNNAVNQAVNDGVTVVVAAGNSNSDACDASPASADGAITVGATTHLDQASSFSSWGDCVNVYAPGSGITAAWRTSPSATNTISGTSMASPHVAGIAAGILGFSLNLSPAGVLNVILSNAVHPNIDSRVPDRPQGLATVFMPVPAPVAPPVASPVAAPAPVVPGTLVIDMFNVVFTFVPRPSCPAPAAGGLLGTSPRQCAQACAVLEGCAGFEMVPGAAGCVLLASDPVDCGVPSDRVATFYERSASMHFDD